MSLVFNFLHNLIDQGYKVHTLFVNTGGISAKEENVITKRANELGAKKHININVEKSLWSEILIPLVQSGALYQNKYPALCSDRYLIVKESIKYGMQKLVSKPPENASTTFLFIICTYKILLNMDF